MVVVGVAALVQISVLAQSGNTAGGANLGSSIDTQRDGSWLFEEGTFGGNGRTCSTCHRKQEGFSTTPASAQKRFVADPKEPLFRPVDSDDGVSNQYTRLLAHATIRVEIPLNCPNIWLEDEPRAKSVVLNRGIPELLNTPALDPILMSDGRVPDLEQQAVAAVHDHVAATVEPNAKDLQRLAQDRGHPGLLFLRRPAKLAEGGRPPSCRPATHRKKSGVDGTIYRIACAAPATADRC